jgi:hypothetical protein
VATQIVVTWLFYQSRWLEYTTYLVVTDRCEGANWFRRKPPIESAGARRVHRELTASGGRQPFPAVSE